MLICHLVIIGMLVFAHAHSVRTFQERLSDWHSHATAYVAGACKHEGAADVATLAALLRAQMQPDSDAATQRGVTFAPQR